MNRMKKYIVVIAFFIISLYTISIQSEEVNYNKNVSVVFDDSGSMAFDVRWAHANYALQTLVSVLDQGDILQIHYMNASAKDVSLVIDDNKSVQEILRTIREKSVPDLLGEGETPIESIAVGLEFLNHDENPLIQPNTLYANWLVLITDGNEMTDANENGYVNYVEDASFDSGYKWIGVLDRKIASILSSATFDFNTVILKIGDTSQDMLLTSSMIDSPLIYKSASVSEEFIQEKQIIENMNDIASLISGRLPIEIIEINGSTMKIKSQVPFNNFDVLLQNSNSKVEKVTSEGLGTIDLDITYTDLLSPDTSVIGTRTLESDTNLFGSAIRLTSLKEEALPEGEYIITFNQNVENAKVTSYCYPFIQFVFKYYVNGLEVNKVYQEDMISLEFIPVRGGTNEVLENLPSDIRYNLELKSGDQFLTFKGDTLTTNEFLIKNDMIEGSLTAEIPDVWLWSLNVSEAIDVAPKEEKAPERVFTLEITNSNVEVEYLEFDHAPYVYLTPLLNGERLSKEQMDLAELNIVRIYTEDGNLSTVDYDLVKEDSTFSFKPTYDGFRPSLPAESYTIEFRFASNEIENTNEYAFGEITYAFLDAPFFVRYFSYILVTMILIIICIYLIGLVLKARFKENKYHISISSYDSIIDIDDPIDVLYSDIKVNKFNRFLVPFKREIGHGAGFDFRAGSKTDHIYIQKKSQKNNMVIGSFELKGDLVGKRDLRLNLNQKLEITENEKLTVYRYTNKKL